MMQVACILTAVTTRKHREDRVLSALQLCEKR